jgi:hypothetical protein
MRIHATCKNVHEVRGRLGDLLDPFTIVCSKGLHICYNLPPFKASSVIFHFKIRLSSKYLGGF